MAAIAYAFVTLCVIGIVCGAIRLGSELQQKGDSRSLRNIRITVLCIVLMIVTAASLLFWLHGTASGQRELKAFNSDRSDKSSVVTVYDPQGGIIGFYEGEITVEGTRTSVVLHIPQDDGSTKRIETYNATVIVEEK